MFNRKQSQVSFFQIAIGSSLVVTVAFDVTILGEAVAGMQSHLGAMAKPRWNRRRTAIPVGSWNKNSNKYIVLRSCCAAARFALS